MDCCLFCLRSFHGSCSFLGTCKRTARIRPQLCQRDNARNRKKLLESVQASSHESTADFVEGKSTDRCGKLTHEGGVVGTSLEPLDGVSEIKTNIAAHRAQAHLTRTASLPAILKSTVERASY